MHILMTAPSAVGPSTYLNENENKKKPNLLPVTVHLLFFFSSSSFSPKSLHLAPAVSAFTNYFA